MIVELETHKAVVEVRAGQPGILREILCEEGGWQQIGKPLAVLSDTLADPIPAADDGIEPWAVNFEIV
jgi:pyruvate/2-oxoglutarate dehydrogenase complex dihydrolipoamide acyltransferase (E2) component